MNFFRRHRLASVVSILAILLLVRVGLGEFFPTRSARLKEGFWSVEIEMNESQVEAILGEPAHLIAVFKDSDDLAESKSVIEVTKIWKSSDGNAYITFRHGKVKGKAYAPSSRYAPNFPR